MEQKLVMMSDDWDQKPVHVTKSSFQLIHDS